MLPPPSAGGASVATCMMRTSVPHCSGALHSGAGGSQVGPPSAPPVLALLALELLAVALLALTLLELLAVALLDAPPVPPVPPCPELALDELGPTVVSGSAEQPASASRAAMITCEKAELRRIAASYFSTARSGAFRGTMAPRMGSAGVSIGQ